MFSRTVSAGLAGLAFASMGVTGQDCTNTTVIQPGDFCQEIADNAGIPLNVLLANNPNVDAQCDNIIVGEPSTRTTAPKTSDATRTVPIRNPARRTKAAAVPDSAGEAVDLARAIDEKLTVEPKVDTKTTLIGRRVTRNKGESTSSLPASSQTREQQRAPAKPTVIRKSRTKHEVAAQDDSETLADELKAKLTITPQSVEERSLDAMRAINSASKGLSSAIQSGWTASCDRTTSPTPHKASKASPSTLTTAIEHFTSAKHSLQTLRRTKPCNMDTERAASSIVGKLISLEMFDYALEALADMRLSITSLYAHDERTSLCGPDRLHLLTLPHPSSPPEFDETLLTLLSTYLLQSMTAIAYNLFRAASESSQDEIEALCSVLHEDKALISWLPHFTSLPSSHLDSVLTRAYTTLAKSTQLYTDTGRMAVAIYRIRVYGILCLAYTSPGVLDPNTFWNQAVKYTTFFVKHAACQFDSSETGQDSALASDVAATICTTFTELVDIAMARPDSATFVGGRGLITFCQYWTSFAKRVSENILSRVKLIVSVGQ
ncbi:hypothetical protein EIP86_004427 [Pleurotus ostreatoroseus]|nr:hypothetical protein EIP86_004427 [Pleurotus ostreatoroseus]